jgi:hypothetical protein
MVFKTVNRPAYSFFEPAPARSVGDGDGTSGLAVAAGPRLFGVAL